MTSLFFSAASFFVQSDCISLRTHTCVDWNNVVLSLNGRCVWLEGARSFKIASADCCSTPV